MSNLKQIGLGVMMYAQDYDGTYPVMSSPSSMSPRQRWADYIFPYVKSEQVFICPTAPPNLVTKAWAHNTASLYGGYGYNYQYLGNSRFPFAARESAIQSPAQTIAVADTNGVAPDVPAKAGKQGTYTIDPPLPSTRGSGKASGFYGDGGECGGVWNCRSVPAALHLDAVNVAFADGHAKAMKLSKLDDFNGDGARDNGFWNGLADATQK